MKTHTWPDGSVSYYYEVGDLVQLTRPHRCMNTVIYKPGDWGRIFRIDKPNNVPSPSLIDFYDIQMAGYCTPKDSFFQAATSVPHWEIEPYIPPSHSPKSQTTPQG
jgi:hypothetical protein